MNKSFLSDLIGGPAPVQPAESPAAESESPTPIIDSNQEQPANSKISKKVAAVEVLRVLTRLQFVCLLSIVGFVVAAGASFVLDVVSAGVCVLAIGGVVFFYLKAKNEVSYLKSKYGV